MPSAGLALVALVLATAGCGHPATRSECEELFERTARIELSAQKIQDQAVVQKRIAEAKAESGEDFEKRCVGKRITDSALACVHKATTTAQFDKCLE